MSYQISIDRVVEMFSTLAGSVDKSEGALFCRSSAGAITEILDQSKDLEVNDYLICYAAATTAYYRYCLRTVGGSADIKAGDITVKEDATEKIGFAEKLMKDALLDIEPLCRNKRFAFIKI